MNSTQKLKEKGANSFRLFSWKLQAFLLFISISILLLSTTDYFKFSKPLESSYIKFV